MLSKDFLLKVFPQIKPDVIKAGVLYHILWYCRYYDGLFNDSRMNTIIAKTAASNGSVLVNHTKVILQLIKGCKLSEAE